MSHPFDLYFGMMDLARLRSLATLDEIAKLPDPQQVLAYRPGPGRAHIGWQFTHIGITEVLTGTERLKGTSPLYPELVPRFKIGSVPDDDVPTLDLIRQVLNDGRQTVLAALQEFGANDLETVPSWYKERGWTIRRLLEILVWHEAHHQGQAHLTLNLWKAGHPTP